MNISECNECGSLGSQVCSPDCKSQRVADEIEFDAFTKAYAICALWSSTDNSRDDGGDPLDDHYSLDDLAPETRQQFVADIEAFRAVAAPLLAKCKLSDEQAGHDFWLTRNRHGAGFWDRGLGPDGEELSRMARLFGDVDLYVGDDKLIHSD